MAATTFPTLTTNLGTIPATFTPPARCFTDFALLTKTNDAFSYYLALPGVDCAATDQNANLDPDGYVLTPAADCYPDLYSDLPVTEAWISPSTVIPIHSPADSCPPGFERACSLTRRAEDDEPTASRESALWNQLEVGQTLIGCCPE
jgi:hypothetical protein